MTGKKRKYKPTPPLNPPRCENCGCPDNLVFYEYVKCGITLCDWCSYKRVKAVKKRKNPPIWELHQGVYIIPEEAQQYMSNE